MQQALGRGFNGSQHKEGGGNEQQTEPHAWVFPSSRFDGNVSSAAQMRLSVTRLPMAQPRNRHNAQRSYAHGCALRFLRESGQKQGTCDTPIPKTFLKLRA